MSVACVYAPLVNYIKIFDIFVKLHGSTRIMGINPGDKIEG